MEENKYYSKAIPVNVKYHGVCYYCGCEAESKFDDYIPQKSDLTFYLETNEECAFAIVQCCKECHSFLMDCRIPVIENRKKHINKSIKKTYKRALNIYERWEVDELDDLSVDFIKSIKAGIALGKEADDRIQFAGYEYELDGTVYHNKASKPKTFTVFGEEFEEFRSALQYAAKQYRINISVLKKRLLDNNIDFDQAINAYHQEMEELIIEKQKEKLCKAFALKHKQNTNFVKSSLTTYLENHPALSMIQCLDLFYKERIKK
ncbi:hypothetical protein [Marinicellulosiphila megalodicopiae]|uniref:hypothetical protein n=1 Tax=Marinicellulosiphila megalodicopiae TaxID=2724896 RepID=UPI003BB03148